jgi:hypothetical protein
MTTAVFSGELTSTSGQRPAITSNQKNWLIIFGATVPATIACAVFLNIFGTTEENLRLLLRVTARTAFLIYLIVFVARPLRQLFVTDATRWLLRERRSFGLSFASVHTVHAALILYLSRISADFEFVPAENLFGAGIYVLILLMAITSFDGPARVLGTRNWRWLHKTGLYVIGFAFVQTLLPANMDELVDPKRMWLVMLTATAIMVRVIAFVANRRKTL